MRYTTKPTATLILSLIFLFAGFRSGAQKVYVKAYNSSLYYHADPGAVFTWSGGGQSGYCHGYGTIQRYISGVAGPRYEGYVSNGKKHGSGTMYYANGRKCYDGNWSYGLMHGYGTFYNENGSINYKGYFVNDKPKHEEETDETGKKLATSLITDVFDGGINGRYTVVKVIYDTDDELQEFHVRVTFSGDIITDNFYDCTMVIKNRFPYLDFINCNETALGYLRLKYGVMVAEKVYKFFEWLTED